MARKLISAINTYYASMAPGACIPKYNAYSMADVYNSLNDIGQNVFCMTGNEIGRPIWFRGQSMETYRLVPSLFRDRENKQNKNESYSTLSLAEEYRQQNFSARVSYLAQSNLRSRVEWQEVLQHHFGKTRFMDWSESVETAVNFALEPFIDTKDTEDNRKKRAMISPGIWVVNPYRLNEHVYDFFADQENRAYIEKTLKNVIADSKIRQCDPARIARELIYAGARRPEMYPDMQAYADYLETKEIFA